MGSFGVIEKLAVGVMYVIRQPGVVMQSACLPATPPLTSRHGSLGNTLVGQAVLTRNWGIGRRSNQDALCE